VLPKQSNIYDLVERAAARRGIPRLELWQDAARALVERELPTLNFSDSQGMGWLSQFRAAVDRGNDPARFAAHIVKRIIVRIADFERWLRKASNLRGPQPGTTGYEALDRKLFPRISKLKNPGGARSAYGAALQLAKTDQIAGEGDAKSKAKRVAKRYLRAYPRGS
jgi:hypothetical protein